jgi:5'-nucleotidase
MNGAEPDFPALIPWIEDVLEVLLSLEAPFLVNVNLP